MLWDKINGEPLGITPNNKKYKSGPEKFLFFARKTVIWYQYSDYNAHVLQR